MSSSQQRAGKTAPRLLQDIALYDPDHPPASGRNLLSEVPPVFSEAYNGPLEWVSPAACEHAYITKTNQTFLLSPEQRRGPGTASKVSAICSRCRYHLQLVVHYTNATGANPPDHIHHLVYKSGRQRGGPSEEITPKGQRVETFHYECSYPTCSAVVSLRMVSPVLGPEWVRLLTDQELLKKRTDEAIAANPERLEGIARPLPINVLDNLRTYIHNALHERQRSKPISAINKRFVVCFGVEGKACKDLLEFLGFRDTNDGYWEPPQSDPSAVPPYQGEMSIFLDDVLHELSVLIDQRPAAEKKIPYTIPTNAPASNDLFYALEASNYPKASRLIEFEMPGEPCYEDLGAVEDMSSPLIVEAYHRQVSVNPARAPHYLKCLKMIGDLRGGPDREIIDQAVMIAYSEGRYTEEDVIKAYKYFGLDPHDPNLTEENIIGKFHAFLSATTQETETRKQLWRIGDFRGSERIKSAAEDRVSTVEQALVFLGVDEHTSDDFIITMYTAKISDSPTSKDLARHAVELIAEARKSETLKHFLKTGETGAGEMDVGDAYRLLQIPDRTVDDAAIIAAYTICIDEAPAQIETYTRALGIIAKEKNSTMLSSYISGSAVQTQTDRNLSEWPVGLQNIGNTCYLNSLLQFYFTIRPYREMVLDFENYKTELDDETLQQKKVGSRKVSRQEVERSQKFLRELRTLFQSMITSPYSSVRPEQELARLTLISSTNEAAIRRRSTISGKRPGGLGEINGLPVMGPLGPAQTTETGESDSQQDHLASKTPEEQQSSKEVTASDMESEATLVSESAQPESQAPQADNKENQPPPVVDKAVADSSGKEITDAGDYLSFPSPVEPPNRPPPVPPRPSESEKQRQLIEEVELGAQQDVTEVINNVLFQSECAIKPRGIAPDGEQLDQIKDLFYGKTISYITAEQGVRSKEELWSDIKVDVATGSRDIYSAIDGAFDVQKVFVDGEVAEQFGSISKLPPILQIQVQRVQFDPVKKTSFKSTNHLELKETIYLDRYMDTQQSELINRRRQCWEWKENLKTLESRRAELLRLSESDGQDMPSLFETTTALLQDLASMKEDPESAKYSIDVSTDLVSELEQLSQITKTEMAFVEQEIKNTQTLIATQFADYKHLAYRLYAVFMHQGSVEFGHYYIYIYDFKKDVWRKYNDSEVTEVQNPAEIFENQGRVNPPTPYFLVYVNAAMKDRLVEPVCREIFEAAPSSTLNEVEQRTNTSVTATATMDVDVDPPSYEEAWTGGPAGPVANPLPSPTTPVSIPLKRKGLEDEMDVSHAHPFPS
ncbi:hypothetical protein VTN77DRAFT_8835 [Rasamsonia byssochlamydoides]|uniref:uncharacterized protein n=1 Tax=Rasamsonia byssochlamydoides TaxID=89139 RepID=UPI0037434654